MSKYPKILYKEEGMREGMQIEDANIGVDDKVELLDALSETGLQQIVVRSEEHTSELQSLVNLVCRLLLEKKNSLNLLHRPKREPLMLIN